MRLKVRVKERQPKVLDVVPVVRCKDCKYYDSHHPYPVCDYHEDNVKETDYCSKGERREIDETD